MHFTKRNLFGLLLAGAMTLSSCSSAAPSVSAAPVSAEPVAASENRDGGVENALFRLPLPAELTGLYEAQVTDTSIHIFDKSLLDEGQGGFVFGVELYAEPGRYGVGFDAKIGELTAADGTLYDVVLSYPAVLQYNADRGEPESYTRLTAAAEDAARGLIALNGGKYAHGTGMKGEELYGSVLDRLRAAAEQGWDANRLEQESFSSMYAVMQYRNIGYIYRDINHDGIDELLIGEIAEGDWKGVIYDVFTMENRRPAHVISGWDRSRYFLASDGASLVNEYSSSAFESGRIIYLLTSNTTLLYPALGFKTDSFENEAQPWFFSTDVEHNVWENITEAEWNAELEPFTEYDRVDFTPLDG